MPPLGALREVSSRRLTSFIPLIRSPYVLVVAGPARRVVDFPLAGCNDSCHLCSGGGPIPIRVQLFLGIRADNFLFWWGDLYRHLIWNSRRRTHWSRRIGQADARRLGARRGHFVTLIMPGLSSIRIYS